MIAYVSDNIILKIAPCHPRHYDVRDVFVQDDAKNFGKYYIFMRDFQWFDCSIYFEIHSRKIFDKDVSKYFEPL